MNRDIFRWAAGLSKTAVDSDEQLDTPEPVDQEMEQAPESTPEEENMSQATPESPESEPTNFLTDEMQAMLSQQVGNEMSAFYEYTGARAWFEGQGLDGFVAWTNKQACDEIAHMQKTLKYMVEAGCTPKMPPVQAASAMFESAMSVVDAILKREKSVTANWRAIAKKAMQDGDAGTLDLAQWFIREQMEEEDTVTAVKNKLDFEEGILMVDSQLLEKYGG